MAFRLACDKQPQRQKNLIFIACKVRFSKCRAMQFAPPPANCLHATQVQIDRHSKFSFDQMIIGSVGLCHRIDFANRKLISSVDPSDAVAELQQ